jgi:hypothetical protein
LNSRQLAALEFALSGSPSFPHAFSGNPRGLFGLDPR